MGPTAALYEALRTFSRPATRREIEREAGLEKPAADGAMRVLAHAGALIRDVDGQGRRGLYQLASGAACPPGRGKYPR